MNFSMNKDVLYMYKIEQTFIFFLSIIDRYIFRECEINIKFS